MYPYVVDLKTENLVKKEDLFAYIRSNRDFIMSKIYELGALLLRNFEIRSADDFLEVVKLINPSLQNYIGGDSPREKIIDNVYSSTTYPKDATISMHHEKSYSKSYPKFLYFFCFTPPVIGGETPILDSRKLYNLLDRKLIDKFQSKKLKYVMNLHNGYGIGKSWQEVFEVTDKKSLEEVLNNLSIKYRWKLNGLLRVEEIIDPIIEHPVTHEKVFFSQAHQWHPSDLDPKVLSSLTSIISPDDFYHNCYYGDDSEIDLEDLNYVRELINQGKVFFKWQRGDVLILDNIISMHGRSPFDGERKILVAMTN